MFWPHELLAKLELFHWHDDNVKKETTIYRDLEFSWFKILKVKKEQLFSLLLRLVLKKVKLGKGWRYWKCQRKSKTNAKFSELKRGPHCWLVGFFLNYRLYHLGLWSLWVARGRAATQQHNLFSLPVLYSGNVMNTENAMDGIHFTVFWLTFYCNTNIHPYLIDIHM